MARRRAPRSSPRRYARTARLNELLREIVAGELEAIDDDRLGILTVTAVDVDGDLQRATVNWTRIGDDLSDGEVNEILEEHRSRLQAAVNAQTHLRRTPVLRFEPDETERSAARVEEILSSLDLPDDEDTDGGGAGAGDDPESQG